MLSSAGINMDAEKQSLIHTTLTLQEQLKESQVALLVEQVCSLACGFYKIKIIAFPIGCRRIILISIDPGHLCEIYWWYIPVKIESQLHSIKYIAYIR